MAGPVANHGGELSNHSPAGSASSISLSGGATSLLVGGLKVSIQLVQLLPTEIRTLADLGTNNLVLSCFRGISWPVGQTFAVGITGSGKLHPIITDQVRHILIHLAR